MAKDVMFGVKKKIKKRKGGKRTWVPNAYMCISRPVRVDLGWCRKHHCL
jgi:hypothetical protein